MWLGFEIEKRIIDWCRHFMGRRAVKTTVIAVNLCLLLFVGYRCVRLIRATVNLPTPPMVPQPRDDLRFGVRLEKRKRIFANLAAKAIWGRQKGRRLFPTHPWSQEDDYHHTVHMHAHVLARAYALNYAQVYLIWDEGIRNRWPGPDNRPVRAYTVPLKPRVR